MSTFRFVVLGAGKIASRFCRAAELLEDCRVCAVASKSAERARAFAQENGVEHFYDSYGRMLEEERPDGAYIAVTTNDHFRLTMLCLEHGVPILCEKAMFQDSGEANKAFKAAAQKQIFVMEAMWSRFLPAVKKAKEWVEEGKIGLPEISQFSIGFAAPEGDENRYYSPALGGGAAKDITVYAYEITTFVLDQGIRKLAVSATWSESGVDINNHICVEFDHTLAELTSSFAVKMDERMVIYGKKGKIVLPCPHYASECLLYDPQGNLTEHFVDQETQNGFTYQMEEMMRCIREGRTQSPVVPWADTTACAELFDRILETRE